MKFNNKILLLLTILSIVLGLIVSKYIAFLNNYRTVTCIVVFVSFIMLYNAYIRGKEMQLKKAALAKLDEEEALLKAKYANISSSVIETALENISPVVDNKPSNESEDKDNLNSIK